MSILEQAGLRALRCLDPETAHGSVRFSLARNTTAEEIDRAVEIIPAVIARLRGSMSAA